MLFFDDFMLFLAFFSRKMAVRPLLLSTENVMKSLNLIFFLKGTLILCSIRLGVFLRRYPIARVFVIVYMVSNCCSVVMQYSSKRKGKLTGLSLPRVQ